MNDNTARDRRFHDDMDVEPQWPQRPTTPQPNVARPRLEPPVERDNRPIPFQARDDRAYRASEQRPIPDPARSSQPTAGGDSAKETRVLPIVEPSRFERGEQTRAVTRPPTQPKSDLPPA